MGRSTIRSTALAAAVLVCGVAAQAVPRVAAAATPTSAAVTPRIHLLLRLTAQTQTSGDAGTQAPTAPAAAQVTAAAQGGTIRGTVVAGAVGKAGGVPLPGVAVTATNTLTGRKYTTATDIDGNYAMVIPRNGRYVVRVELTGFAPVTQEVVLGTTSSAPASTGQTASVNVSDFGMELAVKAATEASAQQARAGTGLSGGLQGLSVASGLGADTEGATEGNGGNEGASMPSLASLNSGDNGADTATESIAVSGQQGSTNSLAGYSEDEIRDRVREGVEQARANGMLPPGADPTEQIVGAISGMMGSGGFGGPGGPGGPGGYSGRHSSGGSGGFGSGAFRNFNPAQPHGTIFYTGTNSALNATPWVASTNTLPHFETNPAGFSNRFGVSLAGSPYIPGLFKPDTRQFVFINLTGQKNLNAFYQSGRVPTALERGGDFSHSEQTVNGNLVPVVLYDPATGAPIAGNNLANASAPATPTQVQARAAAQALLNFYPVANLPSSADPSAYNYQTVTNAGNNNVAINTRYVRTIGQNTGSPFGFSRSGNIHSSHDHNAKPTLRQNINAGFNYSHAAQDNRNIFLALGGAQETNGYGLNLGYTIGYGRLSNNASVNWNRSSAETRNYFTDTANDPSGGLNVPNLTGGFADSRFYNGVSHVNVTNFTGLTNQNPSESTNQTISYSDYVSWRKSHHNYRFGADVRRLHADSIGGSNPLGTFNFTGYATESPSDQLATANGTAVQAASGAGLADFLLGLPTSTSIQASLFKTYLRENILDAYAQDDWRVRGNLTLNYGLRWEYFSPYVEKYNRLVNLDHDATFANVDPVQPGQTGTYGGSYPRSLVNPDRTMFAPRLGFAWKPEPKSGFLKALTKDMVVRGGYGINYNTTQVATFARELAFQPPFAATQTNTASTTVQTTTNGITTSTFNNTGCRLPGANNAGGQPVTLTLASGFGCSVKTIQNNYSVDKNYRLGLLQLYNLNIQRTIPGDIVLNVGYNGTKGSNLDIEYDPNQQATTVTTSNAQAFLYENSIAGSHTNQLVISANKRQYKGLSLGATYIYSHAIDNASSIGGGSENAAQNPARLDLEEGNSSFDQRHNLALNFTLESPFGPNRPFLNKGQKMGKVLDGFILSGNTVFATGTYFTPSYGSSAAEELAGGYYTLRPDRVFSQPIAGPGTLRTFFNKAAFTKPANGFGTASRNSIEGPGTTSVNASLSRVVQLGETRSFEARMSATNVFNTVQYSGINVTVDSANFGQVTRAASMRVLSFTGRYRF